MWRKYEECPDELKHTYAGDLSKVKNQLEWQNMVKTYHINTKPISMIGKQRIQTDESSCFPKWLRSIIDNMREWICVVSSWYEALSGNGL